MEVYAGETAILEHVIYFGGQIVTADSPVAVSIYDSNGDLIDDETATETVDDNGDMVYTVYLGTSITGDYSPKVVEWEYTVGGFSVTTAREHLVVVNPYITYHQYKKMHPSTKLSYTEFAQVESIVRKVIDSYCNQTFNREDNVAYTVTGQNSDSLALPKQLIRLENLSVLDDHVSADGTETPYEITDYVIVDNDNRWNVRRRTSNTVSRSMTPTRNHHFFSYPRRYRVLGDWGWEYVPNNVSRAAALLVSEYENPDSKWREKYVNTISAGDWRMQFGATGDETTGNANADMILHGYRNLSLAVI